MSSITLFPIVPVVCLNSHTDTLHAKARRAKRQNNTCSSLAEFSLCFLFVWGVVLVVNSLLIARLTEVCRV